MSSSVIKISRSEGSFKESTGNATQINDFCGNTVELFLKLIYGENLLKENFTPELLLIAEK